MELSSDARSLDRIRSKPDARHDRIEHIRSAIERGTYATDEKLNVAIDRLLKDL